MSVAIVASSCFVGGVLWAAAADVVTLKIRNGLVLVLAASYLLFAPLCGIGWIEIGQNLLVAAGVLIGMFVLFGFGWIGGGDAKLAAVVTLWLGTDQALAYGLCTALFGGILTIALLAFRSTVLPAQCITVPWIMRLHAPETGVPYGLALAAAALFVFPGTAWMRALT